MNHPLEAWVAEILIFGAFSLCATEEDEGNEEIHAGACPKL